MKSSILVSNSTYYVAPLKENGDMVFVKKGKDKSEYNGEYVLLKNKHLEQQSSDAYSKTGPKIFNFEITKKAENVLVRNNVHKCSVSVYDKNNSSKIYLNNPPINIFIRKKRMTTYNCNIALASVIQKDKKEDKYENMSPIEIDVANNVSIDNGNVGATGGDLKRLTFTIQQMSFFEFKLHFEEKKVENVDNLPKGLFFDIEEQRIVGTPFLSGRYNISVIFSDGSRLNGLIDVPKLNREL